MKGLEDDKNIEEDWPLKDVVFVEDQKSLPIGNFLLQKYLVLIYMDLFFYKHFYSRPCCSCGRFICCS